MTTILDRTRHDLADEEVAVLELIIGFRDEERRKAEEQHTRLLDVFQDVHAAATFWVPPPR